MESRRKHAGFTLIEILISIGIVALLATMLVIAIAPSVEAAKVNATKAVIAQIDQQLQQRMTSFSLIKDSEWDDLAEKVRRTWPTMPVPSVAEIKIAVKKNRYLSAFPQRVQDLYGMDGDYSNSNTYYEANDPLLKVVLDNYGLGQTPKPTLSLPGPSDAPAAGDDKKNWVSSSELIYQLLSHGRSLKTESYNIDGIPSRYITDLDGDGLPEIRDAWGNELQFYNAPTALFRVDRSTTPATFDLTKGARLLFGTIPGDDGTASPERQRALMLYTDPFDKKREGQSTTSNLNQYYDQQTYFSYLIVSGGPDGELGMYEPDAAGGYRLGLPMPGALDAMTDNITNRQ